MSTQSTGLQCLPSFSQAKRFGARIGSLAKQLGLVGLLSLGFWRGVAEAQTDKPEQGSAEFQRMKSLVGTWKGKADMGQGLMEFTVEYRLVSGGTAIEERIFAGTPKEMITMYHDQHGKLALTHYCMLGNRPGMLLKSSTPKTLQFDFDAACGLDATSETHMHSLAITFEDPDTITQDWRLFENGKAKDEHPFTLKRMKF
jgi:hypothetical protein